MTITPPSLVKLHKKLPKKWPTQDLPGVNPEDYWYQAELDQLLNLVGLTRDTGETGSIEAILAAGPPYAGSRNHKRKERNVEQIRDSNPKVINEFFQAEKTDGMCMEEIGSRYMPRFHASSVYISWMVAKLRNQPVLLQESERWLAWFKWWLLQSVFDGPPPATGPHLHPQVYSAGTRKNYVADQRDTYHYWLDTGKPFSLDNLAGDAPTKGGYPGATDVYLAKAATELGLDLKALKPIRPPMMFSIEYIRDENGLLSYFPVLKWRPGNGDIVVAVEVKRNRVVKTVLGEKEPIPAPTWGFDPLTKELYPKERND